MINQSIQLKINKYNQKSRNIMVKQSNQLKILIPL